MMKTKNKFASSLLRMSFLFLFGLCGMSAYAQNKITGTVTDAAGEPLIGVSITLDGGKGTVTNMEGKFSIDAKQGSKLKISYVGYAAQEVKVGKDTNLDIMLQEDNHLLNEVVSIGYGTQKKRDLTGSLATVKSDELTAISASNPIQGLQGRVTGLAVTTNSRPGESPTMRIRGNGSISAGNDPLIVVDGFPLMNSSINEINVNDIASVEVLKDASATAIYGSRGSNGVIMITTKTGAKDTKNLTFNANYGFQMPGRIIETMSHDQFVDFINARYQNASGITVYDNNNPAPATNTDWQRESMYSSKPVQDYSVSLDGTSGDTQYMLSGGVYMQDGLLPSSEFDKYTFHTNLQHKFNNFIKLGTHVQYSYTNANMATLNNQQGELNSIWRTGWNTLPVYRADGTFAVPADDPTISTYFGDGAYWNPVANYKEVTTKKAISRLFGDVYAELQLAKHLTFRTNFGLDISNERDYNYTTSKMTSSTGTGSGGNGYIKKTSNISENILTYSNAWDAHRFSATGVYSWQKYTYESMNMSGKGFTNDETGAWDMTQADRETISYGSTKYENSLISFTGRLTYGYKDRYMVTATGRYDGSSRFGKNNKWGFFPSLGLAWRASEEKFLAGNNVVTNLKVRASYGVTGNQEIGNYQSLAQLKGVNYIYNDTEIQGFYETIGNPNLKWERANQFDVGLDLSLWNRLHVTADYYLRNTSDLLYNVPIPSTSGFSTMLSNVGAVRNKGYEVSITGEIVETKDWQVSATVNLSRNTNEIKELYGGVESITLSSGLNLSRYLKVGESVNARYGLLADGIIRTEEQLAAYQKIQPSAKLGDEMYKDLDGDGKISAMDEVNIGTTDPKLIYGVELNVRYKQFSLNVLGNGAHDFVGGESYLLIAENQTNGGIPSKYAYERMWSTSNPNGTFPAPGASNTYMSDRTCANWNYFILKSISLHYNFGNKPFDVKAIKGLSAFVNFQNFVTFSSQRGYNPESGDTTYPWIKTVNIGVNVKF